MRNKELCVNWDAWYRNYKEGIMDLWRTRHQNMTQIHERNIMRQVMSGVRLWSTSLDREWTLIQRGCYQEWIRFVATKRRGHLRKKMSARQRSAGARMMLMMIGTSDVILLKKYVLLWDSSIKTARLKREGKLTAQRESAQSIAKSTLMAATNAAAALVACAYHERDRHLRYKAFKAWMSAPLAASPSLSRPEAPRSPPSGLLDEGSMNLYECRHQHTTAGEDHGLCGGQVEMSIRDRKSLGMSHGSVICETCAKNCGCGRRGCGADPEARQKLYRVIQGDVSVDEPWCKEQRRFAAMEAEEGVHDEDIWNH